MVRAVIRRVVLVLGVLVMPAAATAGGLDEPRIAPEMIVAETTPRHDVVVPLMALVLFGAAIAAAD
jgi:hypothetical protein